MNYKLKNYLHFLVFLISSFSCPFWFIFHHICPGQTRLFIHLSSFTEYWRIPDAVTIKPRETKPNKGEQHAASRSQAQIEQNKPRSRPPTHKNGHKGHTVVFTHHCVIKGRWHPLISSCPQSVASPVATVNCPIQHFKNHWRELPCSAYLASLTSPGREALVVPVTTSVVNAVWPFWASPDFLFTFMLIPFRMEFSIYLDLPLDMYCAQIAAEMDLVVLVPTRLILRTTESTR